MPITIEGEIPLMGTVELSGAKNSALKLIFAAMFSNEDVVLDNVPRMEPIFVDLEIIRSIGGKAEWIGTNKLLLNGSGISTYEIPQEIGSKYRTTFLLAGPLLYRFGKVSIPKFKSQNIKASPINRIIETWKNLGFSITEDEDRLFLSAENPRPGNISFKVSSHMGTDNAILSSIFLNGDTTINNASEEPEIEDLIDFCTSMGAKVSRIEPRKILVRGTNIFKGVYFEVQPDKTEAVFFSTAAIITKGNIIIRGIRKMTLVPYVNFLTKIGVNFDLSDKELKVWHTGQQLNPASVTVSASPGFVPDWQALAVLTLTQAAGVSYVHDTVYTDRFGFIKDLNRMGAKIDLVKPSSVGLMPVLSDDSYDFVARGEPETVAKITGVTSLRSERLHITDTRYAYLYILTCLIAQGRSEIFEYDSKYEISENLIEKLISLGARIKL